MLLGSALENDNAITRKEHCLESPTRLLLFFGLPLAACAIEAAM